MEITFNAFAYKSSWLEMAKIESGKTMPIIWFDETDQYTKIGTAVVTITLFPKEQIYTHELTALNKALDNVRAENQVRENDILDRISKLTALTYEVAE
jgi:predicted transposase YdaD